MFKMYLDDRQMCAIKFGCLCRFEFSDTCTDACVPVLRKADKAGARSECIDGPLCFNNPSVLIFSSHPLQCDVENGTRYRPLTQSEPLHASKVRIIKTEG